MLIPIPIGAKHVAAVRGAVWKVVDCAGCGERYAYAVDLEATGAEHDLLFLDGKGSAERARARAAENLERKGRDVVVPVPCPQCGLYQEEMARQLREEASINALQIVGAVIAVLSPVPLGVGVSYGWVWSLVLAAAGVAVLAYGYVVALLFDPNAGDAGARKALGGSMRRGGRTW